MKRSVRLRLLVLALLPLVVLLPISLAVTMLRWSDKFDDLLIQKVASDLRIAEQYMRRIVAAQSVDVESLADSVRFERASQISPQALDDFLDISRAKMGLDYLVLRNVATGEVLAPEFYVFKSAIQLGKAEEIALFSPTDMAEISSEMANQAVIPLIETKAAIATERLVEDRGIVILSATHVVVQDEDFVLIGGTLLNQNLDFIDTINDLVYLRDDDQTLRTGTATLFLEDVRVSTNVRLFENVRALGTRVSETVYRTVLKDGQTWLNRAFVVNDWYVSGYLPILDGAENRIGMLYVGFLEQPYDALKKTTFLAILVAFIVVLLVSIPFFLWIARGIFSPLEAMTQTIKRVEAGDLDARIAISKSNDEIGDVARHLDGLLELVQSRDGELRKAAEQLNHRVDERTQALQHANERLEATFKQLVTSEKLAAIGVLTAGVAHEINNPVAVIQGNMEIVRSEVDLKTTDLATEFDLIDEQVHRINAIVGKLLQFARPSEFSGDKDSVDVVRLLDDCVDLASHVLNQSDITLKRDFDAVPHVHFNKVEFQQVIINLLVNAAQAMPKGGVLTLRVSNVEKDGRAGVQITVQDTGFGINQKSLGQVFDPFFTSKMAVGTGLGLSISRSLVDHTDGQIWAESEVGVGSVFFVWIPGRDILFT
jgi:two-component system NtrC family sensor kinase